MKSTPMPRSRAKRRMMARSSSIWCCSSAVVGSSSSRYFASRWIARTTSSNCRWATGRARDEVGAGGGDAVFGAKIVGRLVHGASVKQRTDQLFRAKKEVLRHREFVDQAEFLIDAGNSDGARFAGRAKLHRLAVEADRALVRDLGPGEGAQQSRLAGAVVADERDDLAGRNGEVDVGQRLAWPRTTWRPPRRPDPDSALMLLALN